MSLLPPNKSVIKIGGHHFTVDHYKAPELMKEDCDCGICSRETNTISINARMSASQQEVTFLHEAIHAMNWEIDEALTESLAQQLYQFLSDNYEITCKSHRERGSVLDRP